MSPEDIREQREALAYIKDVKEMILADGRALFATRGLTHHTAVYDVITSTYGGAYQASLICYRNPTDGFFWDTLYEGCRCKDMCTAMKMLWDGIQTGLGDMKVMQYAAHCAAFMSPVTSRSSSSTFGSSPKQPQAVDQQSSPISATAPAETIIAEPIIAETITTEPIAKV